jgi:hypothetical protein
MRLLRDLSLFERQLATNLFFLIRDSSHLGRAPIVS